MSETKMTFSERRASFSLATLMALRMLGLFMILPVFTFYASHLQGATPFLIGLGMGIYGLTQGLFQIPFGIASDHFGRRNMILLGLFIFILGCVISAMSKTIEGMILGRALQGVGAVGSVIMAMLADLTRPNQRTKAMAILGVTIGFSFSLALVLGPLLANVLNIFYAAAFLTSLAILLLFLWVPNPAKEHFHSDTEPNVMSLKAVFFSPELLRLNMGIFTLHLILTANFVVLPLGLEKSAGLSKANQWYLYLPVLLGALLLCALLLLKSQKKDHQRGYFLAAILTLSLAELGLGFFSSNLLLSALSLLLFFTAFSLLEAFLPSLVSLSAPISRKGTALGIYACAQFLGIFAGGILGGWLYGKWGFTSVYPFCACFAGLWYAIALGMKKSPYSL